MRVELFNVGWFTGPAGIWRQGDEMERRVRLPEPDIALYAYTHVAPEGGFDLGPYPAVRTWLDRIATQPGMVPISA